MSTNVEGQEGYNAHAGTGYARHFSIRDGGWAAILRIHLPISFNVRKGDWR